MSTFGTVDHQYLVDNVERSMLDEVITDRPSLVRSLYKEVPWTSADPDRVTFNAIAYNTFTGGPITENENYDEVTPVAGDELTKIHLQYGAKFPITRRMVQYAARNLDSAMEGGRRQIRALNNQLDLEMTNQIFGEADQTTMTTFNGSVMSLAGADGLAIAGSHTVNGSASTWSNVATAAALSEASLTAAVEHGVTNTVDDYGTNMSPNFNTLVISDSPYMKRAAFAIFGSELRPDTSSTRTNAANIYNMSGGWRIIELKYGAFLPTGARSTDNLYRWMIMDSEMAKDAFQYQVSLNPTTDVINVSDNNVATNILCTQFAAYAGVRAQGTVYNLTTTQP